MFYFSLKELYVQRKKLLTEILAFNIHFVCVCDVQKYDSSHAAQVEVRLRKGHVRDAGNDQRKEARCNNATRLQQQEKRIRSTKRGNA